ESIWQTPTPVHLFRRHKAPTRKTTNGRTTTGLERQNRHFDDALEKAGRLRSRRGGAGGDVDAVRHVVRRCADRRPDYLGARLVEDARPAQTHARDAG